MSKQQKGLDGFYQAAHKLLHSYTPKPISVMIRKPIVEQTIAPIIPLVECIGCHQEIQTHESSIRGRILRGYIRVRNGKKSIEDTPGTDRPSPVYANGRMCSKCSPSYSITGIAPTVRGVIQLLRDVAPIPQRNVVTVGMVEHEDALLEIEQEVDKTVYLPNTGPGTRERIRIPINMELVVSLEEGPPVDTNSFRRFVMSRRGGVKDYHPRSDDNGPGFEDTTDMRWFNRG